MITEADHQGGQVMYPTALPTFVEVNCNLHVATKPTRIHVQESENKLLLLLLLYFNVIKLKIIIRRRLISSMGFTFWIYENKVNLSSVTYTPLDPPSTQTFLTGLPSSIAY